jgi:hypothetical protein
VYKNKPLQLPEVQEAPPEEKQRRWREKQVKALAARKPAKAKALPTKRRRTKSQVCWLSKLKHRRKVKLINHKNKNFFPIWNGLS